MQRIIDTPRSSVGLVIGTLQALPYIHLQLESCSRHCGNLPILAHDDGSPIREDSHNLCQRYKADFVSLEQRHPHFVGDMSAFAA
jgi:hypothetical protein